MSTNCSMISRRSLLRSSVAGVTLLALPIRAFAEPITAAAAIGIVMSVLGAINSARTTRDLNARLAEINGKLDTIILNQALLLDEIEQLKLYVDASIYHQFRQDAEFTIKALKDRYDFVFAGATSRPVDELKLLATAVQDTTNKLGQYDFGAFMTFTTGMAMTIVLRRKLRTSDAQIVVMRAAFKRALDAWLDPKNIHGATNAIPVAQQEVQAAEAAVNSYPRVFHYGTRRSRDASSDCTYETNLRIAGDLATGFTGQATEDPGKCTEVFHGDHSGRGIGPFTTEIVPLGLTAPDYSGIPTAPVGLSVYAQVNEINQLRATWIAAQYHVRNLQFVESQIRMAAAAMA